MVLKPLTPVLKIPLAEGWEIQALAAGRTSDGQPTTVALCNGEIKTAQTILLDDITARDALAADFSSLSGLATDILSTTLVQLLPRVEKALQEQGQEEPKPLTKQAERLVELVTQADIELFHYDDRAYASISVATHKETWPLRAKGFRQWLQQHFYNTEGMSPKSGHRRFVHSTP